MSESKILGIVVGIILIVFIAVFGSIVLMGLLNTTADISLTLFKTIYFAFILSVLGIIYLANRIVLGTKTEHVVILLSIILFSAGLAAFVGNLKGVHDIDGYVYQSHSIGELQAQNQYYSQSTQSMITLEESIRSNNRILEAEVVQLTQKINNKTPVVVETIVALPPEVIYITEDVPVSDTYIGYGDDEYEKDDD